MAKTKMTKEEWEKEVEATVAELPLFPPKNTVDELTSREIMGSNVLIYRSAYIDDPLEEQKKKMVKVHCTSCGEDCYLPHVPLDSDGCHMSRPPAPYGFEEISTKEVIYHGVDCLCPCCGEGVTAVHVGRFHKILEIEAVCCLSFHRVRGHLAMLAWSIAKQCDKEGKTFYEYRRYEGAVIINGRPIRVSGHKNNLGYGHVWLSRWEWRKRFTQEIGDWTFDEIINPDVELIESTECAHSALGEYMINCGGKISPLQYMILWLKYPSIENLVRSDLSRILADIIDECDGYGSSYSVRKIDKEKFAQFVNVKAVKPHEMLGITKNELRIARNRSLSEFEFYKWAKKEKGIRLEDDILGIIGSLNVGRVKELVSGKWGRFTPPIVRTVNYLAKQRKVCGSLADARYLMDYWNMLLKVYRTMPEELIYPRDLVAAHNDVMLKVKEKENKAINQKMKKRNAELEKYTYSSEALGLLIRPAHTHGELIKEGKMLHHCVGGYASDHADGKTTIFFIRHIEKPNIPFFTLEYRNGKVNQNRGDHNCARTEDVIAFEAEWLNFISQLKETNV